MFKFSDFQKWQPTTRQPQGIEGNHKGLRATTRDCPYIINILKRQKSMKKFSTIIILLSATGFASASDIKFTDEITQQEFQDFVKEFGTAVVFNPMSPAEPLGILGFDVSVETVVTDISENENYWKKMVDDNDPFSYLPVPRLHVQKGLPFGIDVGAMYSSVPGSNISLWGLEAKYAILEGTTLTPAFSVRGSYSQLRGVDDIDLSTQSVDALVSKGFLMFTPYAGASVFRIEGSENSSLVDLEQEDEFGYRALAGVQFSPLPLFVINGEVSFGETTQFGLKLGLRW
jgi:hypothetical protein